MQTLFQLFRKRYINVDNTFACYLGQENARLGRTVNTAPGKISSGGKSPRKCIYNVLPGDGQTSCKVWLASGERHRCSNEGKSRNPLEFSGVLQTPEPISSVSGPKFAIYCEDMWRRYCRLTSFFRLSMHAIVAKIQPDKILCDGAQMANFSRFFASCIFSEPRAANFKPAF